LQKLFKVIGLNEFLPQDGVLNPISIAACRGSVFTNSLCVAFIFSIVGKSTQLDRVRTQFYSHGPEVPAARTASEVTSVSAAHGTAELFASIFRVHSEFVQEQERINIF
jgi:hypothetical protein